MQDHPLVKDATAKMQKAVDHTMHEFSSIHTGKASPSMVEGVMVEAYGSMMRLKECAAVTTPDARLIQIQPWDKSIIRSVEKALQLANLGINPIVDGGLIRLPIPEMSRERRQDLAKVAKRMAEEGRVSVRNARRDGMDHLRKAKSDGKISEDDLKRYEKDLQHHTDRMMADIERHLAHKEKELTTI